ncbi:hypothetical protein OIY81_654 [Cryptosporidium canis]|uniref:dolichol kinase n=1 Tax=Cryptosporidium canis TaxID=195482 RepID=A0ABQ8P854_9CRYT|nr:hypothetical protein OJ252_1716 [Cryptosporidium canis]KAJ1614057.1 hypothetical protein OIY81_654 [Cryptosporidium canis]
MVVALLIPVNIFAIEVLLSSQITHYGSKRNALYKYLAFPAMCTLCTLLYYMVKYTYGITAFIMKMLVESKVIKQLIAYWVFTIICLPILLKKVGRLKLDSKAKKIFTRKTFHLFLIVLFSPQIISFKITPNHEYQAAMEFTIISIYVASSAFIYLEVVRKCQNGELTNFINGILVPFLDNKDNANSIIITHICLLVGISIPIFKEFLLRKGTSDFDVVSATLGIATIGVGDALSAILGCLYGRIYLPGNRDKTLIGMIAFFVSTCSFLQFTCYFSSNHYSLPKIFLISFFSSLLESYSHYIDNATIPMYSLTLYTNIR